ncbi:MAG: hypothetical protein IJP99_10595 [Methanobrevibacter sp.]|nr:hypothetical protein [Methanobrevibacter sp.]MBR0059766.1 hypothetical protein [Methanobrevibacter sp.]
MVTKIYIDKCTYFYQQSNFNTSNLLNKEYSSILCWLIVYLKSSKNSKKYRLTKKEDINTNVLFLDIKCFDNVISFIPLKSMFFIDNSSKLNSIYSFSMSTSIFCNGVKYKTCRCIDDEKNINHCYGCFFELNRCRHDIINSIESNYISSFIFRYVDVNLLSEYINKNSIKLIRFNNHGSFIDDESVNKLVMLSDLCRDTLFYGYNEYKPYSNDIIKLCDVLNINNLIINGSNHKAHNMFYVTSNLKTYFNNMSKRCLDSCILCKKCLKNTNSININLYHGFLHRIDYLFDNKDNRDFIESFFNNKYRIDDFNGKLFFYKIKNMLKQVNDDLSEEYFKVFERVDNIKNYKDLIYYLESNYL